MKISLQLCCFLLATTLYSQNIKVMAVGDIMMGTDFPSKNYLPPAHEKPFQKIEYLFKDAQLVFGNLEGTLTDTGKNAKRCKDPSKCYSFRSPQTYGSWLQQAGFNLMSIANNHIGDFGPTGIKNTMATLDMNHINYAGVFAKPYTIFKKDSLTYGFCAFAPNRDCLKINAISEAVAIVKKLEEQCDVVIVSFHGGAEGSKHTRVTRKTEFFYGENRGNVHKFSHAVIDAGADLVLGHGPHVARSIEVYKNRLIAYSLGNFCTYKRFNLYGIKGYAPVLEVNLNPEGEFLNGKIHSAKQIDEIYPFVDEQQAAFLEIKKLTTLDFPENQIVFKDDGSFSLETP